MNGAVIEAKMAASAERSPTRVRASFGWRRRVEGSSDDCAGRKSENILSLLLFEAAQVFENHQRFPSHQDAQR